MPRPCAPNSGFSTSGVRASSRAAISAAAACPSTAKVGGVGRPAFLSRNVVIDLSTQRSIACAEFQTGTESLASACRMPRRRVTASNDPAAIERTSTASGSPPSKPGIASPAGRSVSKAIVASGAVATHAPRLRSLPASPPERRSDLSLTMRIRGITGKRLYCSGCDSGLSVDERAGVAERADPAHRGPRTTTGRKWRRTCDSLCLATPMHNVCGARRAPTEPDRGDN